MANEAHDGLTRCIRTRDGYLGQPDWREREQAANLCQLTAAAPGLLVWCGNGHASKI
jgi:hypothetical protein